MTGAGADPSILHRGRTEGRRQVVDVTTSELPPAAAELFGAGFRLALVAAHDGAPMRVVHLFAATAPERLVELRTPVPRDDPVIPSLASLSFPASRFEREMQDLFGIAPMGHPQPARLVLHRHWPDGLHPMLEDAPAIPALGDETQPYPFLTVEGPGVFEIPVGPVHAGVIEPGHFRFSVVGETILNVKARLWFKHKGIERLFQGRNAAEGTALAERISGDTAVGHTLAYSLAVEEALGIQVPESAQAHRAIALELERLYNHITDLGAMANDVGYGIANAHALRVREGLLRLNESCTGHRLLRGAVGPGLGHLRRLPSPDEVAAAVGEATELAEIVLSHPTIVDRLKGTGVLARTDAESIGTLGYVARASGVHTDARADHPFTDLYGPPPTLVEGLERGGDALARFNVRVAELSTSLELIERLLPAAGDASPADPGAVGARSGDGVGLCEGWRGTIAHRVEIAEGRITRLKIVDPSFFNWPALPVALRDVIVPDFPLTNKSFNLSYAGNDL